MGDRRVPSRVRRIVNVESGLNDGIVTPVVLLAIAGQRPPSTAGRSAMRSLELAGGGPRRGRGRGRRRTAAARRPAARLGRRGVRRSRRARPGPGRRTPAPSSCGGNGFVAAFVARHRLRRARPAAGRPAGRALRRADRGPRRPAGVDLLRRRGGAAAGRRLGLAARALRGAEPDRGAHAAGGGRPRSARGCGRRAALFIGWFGPRGLASVVFALLALEELGPDADRRRGRRRRDRAAQRGRSRALRRAARWARRARPCRDCRRRSAQAPPPTRSRRTRAADSEGRVMNVTRFVPGVHAARDLRPVVAAARRRRRAWCSRRCSCRRAWPTPSSPGCRRSTASTPRSSACSAYAVFGPSRILVLGPDSSLGPDDRRDDPAAHRGRRGPRARGGARVAARDHGRR